MTRSRLTIVWGALVVFAVGMATTPARAQDGAKDAADAEVLKKKGGDAMDSGRPADALAAYDQAYALSKDPALLYNRARALQALTEYARALEQYEAFEREAPESMKARVPGLPALIADVRSRVTSLTLTCEPAGAVVRLRGQPLGRCPLSAPVVVNAGKARLDVEADGYLPWMKEIDLPGGGAATFDVRLASRVTTGILVVQSSVPSVTVTIDAKISGTTPLEASLPAGTHVVEAVHDGYRPAKTSVIVTAGERKEVALSLEREKGVLERWWFWAGIGAVVAGGVAVAIALNTEKDPVPGTVAPGVVPSDVGFRF